MTTFTPSIRQKITFGYYAIVAMVIGLSMITLLEIEFIEKKLVSGEAVQAFFDTTIEVRRFEKNYFLFEDESDFREIIQSVDRAQNMLVDKSRNLDAFATPEQIKVLDELFGSYKDFIERHFELVINDTSPNGSSNTARKGMFENRVRDTGDRVTVIARKIQKYEREGIVEATHVTRNVVLISIAILSILVVIAGQILSRIILKPLHLIEKNMTMITNGGFETIQIDSRDREIVSLTNAFNKMLRELELRRRHLVQSEKLASLGTLLSGVAHELNNPLSNISSSGQILMEELNEAREKHPSGHWPLDPDFSAELLMQINDQTDRARNIVRALLDFSRSRKFEKGPVSVKQLFEETIQFVQGQVPDTIGITISVPGAISIFADKQRIQQAFLNLIKNAVDAIAGGTGKIIIQAEQRRAQDMLGSEKPSIYDHLKYHGKCTFEEDTVDIEIRDTGSGIPPDIQPRIFDPFFTTKDVGKGSGLGLFIVHEIIEEHDGCIAVDSKPGRGTTFLIRLPLQHKTEMRDGRDGDAA